ncbi:membralin-like protein At1g60995, partial [Quercus suber]|uniref:membralin-like protein At1g60995 n=1 Tax=Quercus suber TaxID=58331 RepID=UPI0032DF07E6
MATPGCSRELSGAEMKEAQLIQIKITSAGLWSHNESESNAIDVPGLKTVTNKLENANVDGDGLTFLASKFWLNWVGSGTRRSKLAWKFWKTDTELLEHQAETSMSCQSSKPTVDDTVIKIDKERRSFPLSARETFKAAVFHFGKKWYKRLLFIWRHAVQLIRSFWKLWNLAGINLNIDIPKWLRILHLDRLNSYAVHSLEKRIKAFEPTYIYTMEKGYFLLPEEARSRHNIRTVNISISARHSCFGNRWQQLLINRIVGYDTILMNSILTSTGQGYLYNYQTKEFYNLSYAQLPPEGPAGFGDYLVTKCGVLMMSLFVFFTTTMSVSFTLRETQTRMLKFTGLFNPPRLLSELIEIGIKLSQLQSIIMVVNTSQVPALQRFMQHRRSQLQQPPDFHITSSTILASTLHITRLNTRNPGPVNTDLTTGTGLRPGSNPAMPANGEMDVSGLQEQSESENRAENPLQQADNGPNPGAMNAFSSLLLWILGGASSEGLNSFLSMFRDVREQGQVYAENRAHQKHQNQILQVHSAETGRDLVEHLFEVLALHFGSPLVSLAHFLLL